MTEVSAWTSLTNIFSGNTSFIQTYVSETILPYMKEIQVTDAKVIAATLGISLATYLYIKYKGTKEQNEIIQKELNRRRSESEYSSLAKKRHRRSRDFDSDHESDNERHKRHTSRRSRDSSSTPVKKRKGGSLRRRKSSKKR